MNEKEEQKNSKLDLFLSKDLILSTMQGVAMQVKVYREFEKEFGTAKAMNHTEIYMKALFAGISKGGESAD